MLWKTHIALGLIGGLFILNYFTPTNYYSFFAVIIFASIFPDIDHTKSKISGKIPIIPGLIQLFTKHRGIIHSFPFAAVLAIIINKYNQELSLAFLIGYLSHLIGDSLTLSGINFLHPFSRLKVQGFIQTGGLAELIFFLGMILVIFFQLSNLI
jgi:inner membrane protein